MAKQNKPAIRFKGFTDAWEQRKFSDITFPAGEKNKENLPLESYSITNESGFVPQDEKFENGGTMREADKRMYYIVSPNSFAYNPARINVGSIGYQDTGKSVIVSSLYEVFKTSDDVDDRLLWHWFKSPDFQKLIMQLQEGGVRLYFYYDKLCMGQVPLPSLEEQRKIGKLFDTLDHLITLHQRKYDKLQVLKKAMLEKMFPKNGSSVPEIRFKGFTDAWEQRKLGEILQERNTRTSDFESNPLYSLTIESGVTPKTDRYERSSLVTKTEDLFKTVKPNEFVTNPMNLRFGALGYNKNAFTVSVSGYYDVFSIDDDKCSGFWNAYFKTPTAMNIFDNAATGSLIEKRRVKYSTLQQLAFYMPNDLSEKAEIGKYMDTFDHLITLHQRELEKLQNIKKSMLEKMFV